MTGAGMNYELMPRVHPSGQVIGWAVGCYHCPAVHSTATIDDAAVWMASHDSVHGRVPPLKRMPRP